MAFVVAMAWIMLPAMPFATAHHLLAIYRALALGCGSMIRQGWRRCMETFCHQLCFNGHPCSRAPFPQLKHSP
jgi:hypothetical protein